MSRSSSPVEMGSVEPEIFERIKEIIPPDAGSIATFRPDSLKTDYSGPERDEVLEIVSPLADKVINDFTNANDGIEPTEVRLDVTHNQTVHTKGERWHQLLLFPKSILYEVHSQNASEFAVGNVPGLSFMPNFLLGSVAKGLVARGNLDTVSVPPNTLIRSDTHAIRKREDTHPEGVISISFDVFNGFLSCDALESSRKELLRARLLATR